MCFIFIGFSNHIVYANASTNDIDIETLKKRNEELNNQYGISYEDLFNVYMSSLNADEQPLMIVRQTGSAAASELSFADEFFAAAMEALSNTSSAVTVTYRNIYGDSEYNKQLDDLTILYVNEVFENKTVVSNAVNKVEKIYSNYRKTRTLKEIQEAFDKDEFNLLIDAYYKDVTTEKELKAIKEAMMGKEEFIKVSLGDKLSMAEYYIFLLESYHTNYEIIKKLQEMIPEDSVLGEGLSRYVDNYNKLFLPIFIDYLTNEVFLKKVSDALIKECFEWDYIGGAWKVVQIAIEILDYIYEQHRPSATDITRYFLLDGFLSSVEIGLMDQRLKMNTELIQNNKVSIESINDYEFLYNTKIKTIEMYLSAAMDITKSSFFSTLETNLQAQIRILLNSIKSNYDYDYYIDLCAKKAIGETIDESDLAITEIECKVKTDETINIYKEDNIIKCTYTDIEGKTKKLAVFNGKVFGGIELCGGSINVKTDVKTSYILIKDGKLNTNGYTIVSDKIDFRPDLERKGTVIIEGQGNIISNQTMTIERVSIIGNDAILESKKSIVLSSFVKYGGGVSISDCTFVSCKGLDSGYNYGDFWNTFDNVIIKCNVIGGSLKAIGDVKISGKAMGNLYVCEDVTVEGASFASGSIYNNGGIIISRGDFSYSDRVTSENSKSKFIVYGNIYANGYTGGWWALSQCNYFLTEGSLELYGNLYGIEDVDGQSMWSGPYYYSFTARENFIVKLCGSNEQKIVLPGNSGTISNLYLLNNDISIDSDLTIEHLYGNMNIKSILYNVNIENAHNNTITVGEVKKGSLSVSKGICSVNGDSYGEISVNDGVGTINGAAKGGIKVNHGTCITQGTINGTINIYDGELIQNNEETINADSIWLENGVIKSGGNVTFTNILCMKGSSELSVNGDLYVNGSTIESYSGWYSYVTGGTIEISGDMYVESDKEHHKSLYMNDDAVLSFTEGNHSIYNKDSIRISNLKQSDNSVIKFNNSDCVVDNIISDIVVESSYINISNWNNKTLINKKPKGLELGYPSDYIKLSSELSNNENDYIDVYMKCNNERGTISRNNNTTFLDMYMGESNAISFDKSYSVQISCNINNILDIDNNTITPKNVGTTSIQLIIKELDVSSECSVNILNNQNYCNKYGHNYDAGTIIQESTCSETGMIKYICNICGNEKNDSISKKQHFINILEQVNPTCTEDGLTEGQKCSACGEILIEQKTVSKLGHDWNEEKIIKKSSCEEEGLSIFKCNRCKIEEERIIEKSHDYYDINNTYIAPTCMEDGKSADQKCSKCNDIKTGNRIVALGHKMIEYSPHVATYDTEGNIAYWKCERCEKFFSDSEGLNEIEENSWIIPIPTSRPTEVPTLVPIPTQVVTPTPTSMVTPTQAVISTPKVTPSQAISPTPTSMVTPTSTPISVATPTANPDDKYDLRNIIESFISFECPCDTTDGIEGYIKLWNIEKNEYMKNGIDYRIKDCYSDYLEYTIDQSQSIWKSGIPSEVGEYNIVVEGLGIYHGEKSIRLIITDPKNIESYAYNNSAWYNGKELGATDYGIDLWMNYINDGKWIAKSLMYKRDYDIVGFCRSSNYNYDMTSWLTGLPKNPGSYYLKIVGIGEYTGTRYIDYQIFEEQEPIIDVSKKTIVPFIDSEMIYKFNNDYIIELTPKLTDRYTITTKYVDENDKNEDSIIEGQLCDDKGHSLGSITDTTNENLTTSFFLEGGRKYYFILRNYNDPSYRRIVNIEGESVSYEYAGEGDTINLPTTSPNPTQSPTPTATPTVTPTSKPSSNPTQKPSEKPEATPTTVPTQNPDQQPTVAPSEKATPTAAPTSQPTPAAEKDKATTFSIKNKKTIKKTAKIKVKDKDKIKKITLNGKIVKIKKNKTSITVKLKSYKKYLKKKGKWNTLKVTDNKGNTKTIKFKTK